MEIKVISGHRASLKRDDYENVSVGKKPHFCSVEKFHVGYKSGSGRNEWNYGWNYGDPKEMRFEHGLFSVGHQTTETFVKTLTKQKV